MEGDTAVVIASDGGEIQIQLHRVCLTFRSGLRSKAHGGIVAISAGGKPCDEILRDYRSSE